MPRSSKKKGKVADFTKAKLKLGKGKAQPSNAIDTSFKARSIALPSQSITAEKDASEPLTNRQLAFRDLISHLKHYNAGTRRDAILGLKELLDSNWELVDPWMTPLFTALARLIGDEDASVRKQLISFFAWLLPKIPTDDLVPHSPLLLLFTTSAQTHIFPEIRIDAIRFLDILLECVPEAVTAGWSENKEGHGTRVLEGYLGILNAGTKYGDTDGPITATSTASVVLTPASKLAVLRSLSSFLHVCLSFSESNPSTQNDDHLTKPLDTWFMRYHFSSVEEYLSFDEIFRPESQSRNMRRTRRVWKKEKGGSGEDFTQCFPLCGNTCGQSWKWEDLSNLGDMFEQESSQSMRTDFVSNLARTLHSTFVETFLDCAPSVFPPSSNPAEAELQLVLSVVRIARCLYQCIIQSSQDVDATLIERLDSIVGYMATYFPASNNSKNIKTEQAFEEYNLSFCTLVSLLVKASEVSNAVTNKKSPKNHLSRKSKATSSMQTDHVSEYIIHRLAGTASVFSSIAVPITPAAYIALLPSIWVLISNDAMGSGINNNSINVPNSSKQHKPNEILHAVLDHALKVSSKSPCKRPTVEFIARILLLNTSPHHLNPSFLSERVDPSLKPKVETWLLHLVQVLWELGTNNILFTEIILRVLLRTLQRRCNLTRTSAVLGSITTSSSNIDNGNRIRASAAVAHGNTAHTAALITPDAIASIESRLVPYFFISHPTRGPLMGPFRKLLALRLTSSSGSSSTSYNSTRPVYLLAFDVAATLLVLDRPGGKEAEALENAVGLALAGADEVAGSAIVTEMKDYWDHVRLMAR